MKHPFLLAAFTFWIIATLIICVTIVPLSILLIKGHIRDWLQIGKNLSDAFESEQN